LGKCVIVETKKYGGRTAATVAKDQSLTTPRIAALIEGFQRTYDVSKVMVDPGSMGSFAQAELMDHFGIFTEAAKKSKKNAHIEFLNGDLQTGELVVIRGPNQDLVEEITLLQWDSDAMDDGRLIEDRSYDNHACDAMLYAWRSGYHKDFEWEEHGPKPGSPEAEEALEEARYEKALADGAKAFDPYLDLDAIEEFADGLGISDVSED
jgi:hypothetical protein